MASKKSGARRRALSGSYKRVSKLLAQYDAGVAAAPMRKLTEERDTLKQRLADADALIRRAAQDSCVTTSEEGGPGCFYCDHEEHTDDCPAARWLAERGK